jgi:hypothetical protein
MLSRNSKDVFCLLSPVTTLQKIPLLPEYRETVIYCCSVEVHVTEGEMATSASVAEVEPRDPHVPPYCRCHIKVLR